MRFVVAFAAVLCVAYAVHVPMKDRDSRPIYDCIEEFMNGPMWPAPLQTYSVSDWNVVTFDGFKANTGDVEGRVAVRNKCHFGGGFTIGYEINSVGVNRTDSDEPWALVVGGDLTFLSGAVYPDGSGRPNPSKAEGIYVGGNFTGASYLKDRITGGPGSLDAAFDGIRPWYRNLGVTFANATQNMFATFTNGGIFLTATNQFASRYYVHIDADDFAKATYVTTSGVNVGAEFIITLTGGDVTFDGGDIPSISEKTVFNIVGKRNIYNKDNCKGSLLAPDSTLYQTGGDQIGFVAVGDIQSFVETRKPFCNIMCCIKWGPCNNVTAIEM